MNYFSIEPVECNNGTGFGTTLFVSGCEHHCDGCFNVKTWNKGKGDKFTRDTFNYLKKCIENDNITRLTFSGGDPLSVYNRLAVLQICSEIKTCKPTLDIWIYTGYTYEQLLSQSPLFVDELCKYADHLVDGKYEKDETHTKPFRGSDNQRVWNLKTREVEL